MAPNTTANPRRFDASQGPRKIGPDEGPVAELGGRRGVDLARVVLAVGEQDDDLALGLALLEPRRRRGDGAADGRSVHQHAHPHAPQHPFEEGVVERERGLGVGLRGEDDEPDPVRRPPIDEVGGDGALEVTAGWVLRIRDQLAPFVSYEGANAATISFGQAW